LLPTVPGMPGAIAVVAATLTPGVAHHAHRSGGVSALECKAPRHYAPAVLRPVPDLPPSTGCEKCHGIVKTRKGGGFAGAAWAASGAEDRRNG